MNIFTVHDLIAKDYEGTVTKIAGLGYREIEPATDYGQMEPKQFCAMLDHLKLSVPSTHVGATEGEGLK